MYIPSNTPSAEEFIQVLRERHIIKPKMSSVLDHITLYVRDLHVYKVLLAARYDATSRQMKKAGLNEEYTRVPIDNERIQNNEVVDISHGNYMLVYDIRTHDIGIYAGEPE